MEETVEQLEAKLKKAKKNALDKEWEDLNNNFKKMGEYLKGKTIIHFYTRYSWAVTKITDFNETYYADGSGFYGQWNKARWYEIKGARLGYNCNTHQKVFHSDGQIDEDDLHRGLGQVHLENVMQIGIPLEPKKKWNSHWQRFLELGELDFSTPIFSIGEEAYKKRDIDKAKQALTNFQLFCRLVDESLWDELYEYYKKRVDLAHELYLKFPEDRSIVTEEIPWEEIFKKK